MLRCKPYGCTACGYPSRLVDLLRVTYTPLMAIHSLGYEGVTYVYPDAVDLKPRSVRLSYDRASGMISMPLLPAAGYSFTELDISQRSI